MADGSSIAREFDIRQIAAALRMTKRSAERRAIKENWSFFERQGRGGKRRIYGVSDLPKDVREALNYSAAISAARISKPSADFIAGQSISRRIALKEKIDEQAARRIREAGLARAAGLRGRARRRMEIKLDLLARVDSFAAHQGLGICAAREGVCAAIADGQIQLPDDASELIGSDVSPASLGRWQRTLLTQGAAALAGDYGNRKGSGAIESQPDLRDFALGLLTDKPHTTAKNMHRAICARFSGSALKIPTERTVARFLSRFKSEQPQLFTAISNPDAWKNRYMSAFGSASEGIDRLNQRWEFDSSPADLMLTDGRHTLVQIVDIWSRRRLFHVAKSSSSAAVCCAIRRAILAWGVLEEAKIDNGQDYVGERVTRTFKSLGVDVLVSPPFSPWKKPFVESGFKIFAHGIMELLPGYLGHDVADQQAIRASKSFAERLFKKNEVIDIRLSSAELQTFCDRWCRDLYEHEAQSGLNGKTVHERVASWTGEVRRITDERVLDLLLAAAPDNNGGRTVTKKGIRIDGLTYIAPELHGMVGERVQALFDERDVGRIVVYHNEAFCCVAECPEVLGVSRAEIAAEAARQRKHGIAAQRAEMRRLKAAAKTRDIAWEILDQKARENAAHATLPLAENVEHLTPAIEAARQAADAKTSFEKEVDREYFVASTEAAANMRRPQIEEETAEQRFKWALDQLLLAPEDRTEFDRRRLSTYRETSEFSGRWLVFQGFGRSAFPTLDLGEAYDALLEDGALAHRYRELEQLYGPTA